MGAAAVAVVADVAAGPWPCWSLASGRSGGSAFPHGCWPHGGKPAGQGRRETCQLQRWAGRDGCPAKMLTR